MDLEGAGTGDEGEEEGESCVQRQGMTQKKSKSLDTRKIDQICRHLLNMFFSRRRWPKVAKSNKEVSKLVTLVPAKRGYLLSGICSLAVAHYGLKSENCRGGSSSRMPSIWAGGAASKCHQKYFLSKSLLQV